MNPPPSALTLTHHELRFATTTRVPLHLSHNLSAAVSISIGASHHGRRTCRVGGTDFELFADLGRLRDDFNSYLILVAAAPMAGGRVETGSLLYTGVVASEFATSATAYRQILREYVAAMVKAPPELRYSAFGLIPRELPWAWGFLASEASLLTIAESDQVMTVARIAGVELAKRGQQAREKVAHEGRSVDVDVEEYPELG